MNIYHCVDDTRYCNTFIVEEHKNKLLYYNYNYKDFLRVEHNITNIQNTTKLRKQKI